MTRYRCYACHRRLTVPGYVIADGRMLGPICAAKPGVWNELQEKFKADLQVAPARKAITRPRKKSPPKAQKIDLNQFELELQ